MAYTPENKFKIQLKKPGDGQRAYGKNLLANVACCSDPNYSFTYGYNPGILPPDSSVVIYVDGGCPDYTWDVTGSEYSWATPTTSVPYNTLTSTVNATNEVTNITITDACSTVINETVNNCPMTLNPPWIVPADGAGILTADVISMETVEPGTSIYYTTDGSTPDKNSTLYTGPVPINEVLTWKAIAYKDGFIPSPVRSVTYYIIQFESSFIPGQGSDDGQVVNEFGGDFDAGSADIVMGVYYSLDIYEGFIRFPNVTVPQGAQINSASIRFYNSSSNYGRDVSFYIRANDVDTALAPTNQYEFSMLSATSEHAVQDWSDLPAGYFYTGNFKQVVQEVINRPGWVTGNALMILFLDNGNTPYNFIHPYSWSGGDPATRAPRLTINYIAD